MPAAGRFRSAVTWALAWAVACLGAFALVVSVNNPLIFAPAGQSTPVEAVALVAVTATTFALVGGLIAVRVPGNVIGRLLLATGWCIAITLVGMAATTRDWPGAQWWEWSTEWVGTLAFVLTAYLLALFPDGHLPSPRWRPALWLTNVTGIALIAGAFATPYVPDAYYRHSNPLLVPGLQGTVLDNSLLGFLLLPLVFVVSAWCFVWRYRRSTGSVRAQLKWFAYASGVVMCGYLFQNVTWVLTGALDVDLVALGLVVLVLSFNAVPLASGFAILHYRLYDIDRVVSRSVSYVALTAVVVAVYALVVTTASLLLPSRSSMAVALATLAAASVLEPTRRQMQRMVDRRFNRARYDSLRTVDDFGARLAHEIDPLTVRQDLCGTVATALNPVRLSIWTRP